MKNTHAIAATTLISLLALTGCGANNASDSSGQNATATATEATTDTPSELAQEVDQDNSAPEAAESAEHNEPLASLAGFTLKGNDIRFDILSPAHQQTLNETMPSSINGAWGVLCSTSALETQLDETGASTTSASGVQHTWRSLKYALPETGTAALSGEASDKAYEAASLHVSGAGNKCVLVHTPDTAAATKTETATIGQYVGTTELLSTVVVPNSGVVAPPVIEEAPAIQEAPAIEPYKNCAEARAAGDAPIYPDNPRWGDHLDGIDNDGIGCES